MTNRLYMRNLAVVTAAHLGTLLLVVALGAVHGCKKSKPAVLRYVPVAVIMEPTAPVFIAPEQRADPPPPGPAPVPEPEIKNSIPPPPKDIPKPPQNRRQHVKKPDSTRRPPQPNRTSRRVMTEQEVRKMLNLSSGTSALDLPAGESALQGILDEDAAWLEMVRQAYYDAWSQPCYADVGSAGASVTVSLAADGTVTRCRMTRASGNALLDESTMKAAEAVKVIRGLPPEFTAKHGDIEVIFRVVQE